MTKTQLVAAAEVLVAVADSIRQLSPVPSGQLYAIGCASFVSLPEYERIIEMLKGAGLVREDRHLLIWTGPAPLERRAA